MTAVSARAIKKPKSGNLFPLTLPRERPFLSIYQAFAAQLAQSWAPNLLFLGRFYAFRSNQRA
jgi:hypothetical protein